jgi:hypothetical protein
MIEMRRLNACVGRSAAIMMLAVGLLSLPATGTAQVTYVGQAAAVSLSVLGAIHVSISDTGALPASGGALASELLSATVPNILQADVLTASTQGAESTTTSQASVADVSLTVLGIDIKASVLTSNASASCVTYPPTVSGSSSIASLTVNGLSVEVTGAPNQTIPLLVAELVINEQIPTITYVGGAPHVEMLVNALHLKAGGLADVAIASSLAGMNCLNAEQ